MPRASTGKKRRFEIFKRDNFACQYCGAQPPDVLLVVDHITAVAAGGTDTVDNLITACQACNQGKAARPLTTRIIRPDADLLYLETQQEIAELRRFQGSLQEKEAELAKVVQIVQEAWHKSSGLDWVPSDPLLRQLLNRYTPEIVYATILDVAPKVAQGYVKDWKWDRYAWAVARNMARERGEQVDEIDPESRKFLGISDEKDANSNQ